MAGVGYLITNDLLTDAAFMLFQPSVNAVVPGGGIAIGAQTVSVYDPSMYVGAQIIVGAPGTINAEVVTITAVSVGVSFTATFANTHAAGVPITGATFPVRQAADPLFTQAEMLTYLGNAFNDFLTDVPLAYAIATVTVNGTQQNAALPADSMFPVRAAVAGYPLRETSQSNLDAMNWIWTQQSPGTPRSYFRDKIPAQSIGLYPRPALTTAVEVVYAQRNSSSISLLDGFIVPDPFCQYPWFRMLSFAFSKDGEAKNPALAKYCQSRYDMGVKVSKMFLENLNDPNLQMG